MHIHKENHRKDFEKFGNKKTIKINELNKKVKKMLGSLADSPTYGYGPKDCAPPEREGAGLSAKLRATNRTRALQVHTRQPMVRWVWLSQKGESQTFDEAEQQCFSEVYKAQIELELNQIRDEIKEIKKKKKEEDKHRYYYIQREIYNKNKTLSKIEIAAYFIYLNKAGFNGMYRENLKGHFNIPKGDLKNINIDEKKLRQASKILNQNVQIRCASYNEIDALAKGLASRAFILTLLMHRLKNLVLQHTIKLHF